MAPNKVCTIINMAGSGEEHDGLNLRDILSRMKGKQDELARSQQFQIFVAESFFVVRFIMCARPTAPYSTFANSGSCQLIILCLASTKSRAAWYASLLNVRILAVARRQWVALVCWEVESSGLLYKRQGKLWQHVSVRAAPIFARRLHVLRWHLVWSSVHMQHLTNH